MYKILLFFGVFYSVLCFILTKVAVASRGNYPQAEIFRPGNFQICKRDMPPDINKPAHAKLLSLPFNEEDIKRLSDVQQRSYYSGYGSTPAYYPSFDPFSILASLAFLAFLLQSVASIFDRSRSILPTISDARRATEPHHSNPLAERILEILEKYENQDQTFMENTGDGVA